jgi:hypothetical protein
MRWRQRDRDGCPPVPDELVHHSAAGSRLGLNQTEQQQTTGKINSADRCTLAEWFEAVA